MTITIRPWIAEFRKLVQDAHDMPEGSLERSLLCDYIEEHYDWIMGILDIVEIQR